jgi:hypothetical protein
VPKSSGGCRFEPVLNTSAMKQRSVAVIIFLLCVSMGMLKSDYCGTLMPVETDTRRAQRNAHAFLASKLSTDKLGSSAAKVRRNHKP